MKQREIRFRAWDIEAKKIDYPKVLATKDEEWCEKLNSSPFAVADVWYGYEIQGCVSDILMQYTGLKDKNGIEIYEGDIITHKRILDNIGVNNWEVEFDKDRGQWYCRRNHSNPPRVPLCDICSKSLIIDNRYENPELLTC